MTQGKTPQVYTGKHGCYVFSKHHEKYMREDGTWHGYMDGQGGTWFASREDAERAIARASPDAPVMTLPNGDVLREGDWALTKSGKVVGPADHPHACFWFDYGEKQGGYYDNGQPFGQTSSADPIIAKAPAPRTSQAEDGPDYNDGKWHAWSGEPRCPVHTESRIDHVWHDDNIKNAGITKDRLAGAAAWGQTLKFRVTKPAPTRVTVDLLAGTTDETIARIGTIEYEDGKPDADSIKLEVT